MPEAKLHKTCHCGEEFLDFYYGITLVKIECPNGHSPLEGLKTGDVIEQIASGHLKCTPPPTKPGVYVTTTTPMSPWAWTGEDPYAMDFDAMAFKVKHEFSIPKINSAAVIKGVTS